MRKKLWIRADGNGQIGMGHIMRCLTIADACKKKQIETTFILADNSCLSKVQAQGYEAIVLETDYREMETELELLQQLIQEGDQLLIDSYQVTPYYMQELSKRYTVIYMDDLGNQTWPVQAIVNYNLYATELPYEKYYQGAETKRILGSTYVPLRAEFRKTKLAATPQKTLRNLLISTGGSDSYKIALQLVKHCKLPQVTYHVVCGPFSASFEELKELEKEWGRETLVVHSDVQDMAGLMRECDLAVSAAGSTLYELCAMGIPTVSFTFAENQLLGAHIFDRLGIIYYAGDYREDAVRMMKRCEEKLRWYSEHVKEREEISTKMRKLIDGYGADRIAERIKEL